MPQLREDACVMRVAQSVPMSRSGLICIPLILLQKVSFGLVFSF